MDDFDKLFPPKENTSPNGLQSGATTNTSEPNSEFDSIFPDKSQKQSSFMDLVDSYNNQSRKLANGILQPIAYVTDKLGMTDNFSGRLAKDTQQFQQAADIAAVNSPKASFLGNALGSLSNIGYTSTLTGGLGFGSSAAKGVTGRMAEQGLLAGTESGAEYGSIKDRATGTTIGGLTGAASQGILGEAIPALASKGAQELFTGSTPQEAADILNNGGLLTAGSATGNKIIQQGENYLSKLPLFGSKTNMANIANRAIDKTKDFLADQGLPIGKDGIENTSMGDLSQSLLAETKLAKQQAQATTSAEYGKLNDLIGDTKIPMTNVSKLAGDILNPPAAQEGYTAAEITDPQIKKSLENIRDMGKASPETFNTISQDLGSYINDISDGTGNSRLLNPLVQLKNTLDNDVSNFRAQLNPEAANQLNKAQTSYRQLVEPFNENPILRAVDRGNMSADQLLQQVVSNDSPATTKILVENLTPQGQQDFTKALLLKAANNSFDEGTNTFNAKQFGINLANMGETLKALPDNTQTAIKGLQAILTSSAKPLDDLNKSITMSHAAGLGATSAAAAMSGLHLAGGLGLTTKAISYMLTNPNMVRQLVRLGGGELNEKTTDSTIKYILQNSLKTVGGLIPATTGSMVGNDNKDNP